MERLTKRLPDNLGAVIRPGYGLPEALDRLAAYEDTGLEPEEISIRRWIPVTERLPGIDDGDWVLGVVNGFAYGIVYKNAIVTVEYYENSGCWSLHDLDAKVAVTHWMPLPEPPEEVTQDD